MARYVWQGTDWERRIQWDAARVLPALARVRRVQGRLLGRAEVLDEATRTDTFADRLTEDALQTAAIDGETLDPDVVSSAVARRLDLGEGGPPSSSPVGVDGLVDVLLDATRGHAAPLTAERLRRWHSALSPKGGGRWRTGARSARIVSSRRAGHEQVHYEAPPSEQVAGEMERFVEWWNDGSESDDGVLRAALAHFRFLTIHPFAKGNGKVGRAIADLALSCDEETGARLYSLSATLRAERLAYFAALNEAQRGDGDVTGWLLSFLGWLEEAITHSVQDLANELAMARYGQRHGAEALGRRQRTVLRQLLRAGPGGLEGGLTTREYVSFAKTSRTTAQREITDLHARGLLVKRPGKGRGARYDFAWESVTEP